MHFIEKSSCCFIKVDVAFAQYWLLWNRHLIIIINHPFAFPLDKAHIMTMVGCLAQVDHNCLQLKVLVQWPCGFIFCWRLQEIHKSWDISSTIKKPFNCIRNARFLPIKEKLHFLLRQSLLDYPGNPSPSLEQLPLDQPEPRLGHLLQ